MQIHNLVLFGNHNTKFQNPSTKQGRSAWTESSVYSAWTSAVWAGLLFQNYDGIVWGQP